MSTEADVRAVEDVNRALYAAVENADLDAMSRLWFDDGDRGDDRGGDRAAARQDEGDGDRLGGVVCVHPGWPPVHGRSHVLRSWALVMAGTPYIQFFLTDVRTSVFDDLAVVTCAENILTGMEGQGADGFAGGQVVTTNVFRRTTDGWRVLVHHASPVMARDDAPDQGPAQERGQ